MAKAKVIEREAPVASLEDKIAALRDECNAFIDRKAEELRQSAPGIPVGVMRGILTGNETCQCRAALNAMSRK